MTEYVNTEIGRTVELLRTDVQLLGSYVEQIDYHYKLGNIPKYALFDALDKVQTVYQHIAGIQAMMVLTHLDKE